MTIIWLSYHSSRQKDDHYELVPHQGHIIAAALRSFTEFSKDNIFAFTTRLWRVSLFALINTCPPHVLLKYDIIQKYFLNLPRNALESGFFLHSVNSYKINGG